MSNEDIKTMFERSGLPCIRAFIETVVKCWREHPELHDPRGTVSETFDQQVKRLLDLWERWQPLPDIYHDLAREALSKLQPQATREAA